MVDNLYILSGKNQGESFKLENGKTYIAGRGSENDIIIADPGISRRHLKIENKNNHYFIMDLHSKNGTFVDGRELDPGIEVEVREEALILIGTTIFSLGETCESCLKPFLDSAAFNSEITEYREASEPINVTEIKKNLKSVYALTNSIMESKDVEEILKILSKNIFNLLKRVDHCVVLLVNEETGKINYITSHSRKPIDDPQKVYNPEIVKQALIIKKPVIVEDSDNMENEDDKLTESLHLMKIRSAICVPIAGSYGVKGAIYVDSVERPYGFQTSDVALLKDMGDRASQAIDKMSIQQLSGTLISLKQAEEEVQRLRGILSICSYCHKIRNDEDSWDRLEVYISTHSEAKFSHGICPECYKKVKSEEAD